MAVINDSEQALNAYEECFIYEKKVMQGNKQVIKKINELKELKTLLKNGKPICYLNMFNFCKDGEKYVNGEWKTFYNITHTGLAEGNVETNYNYFTKWKKGMGLGYMFLRPGNAM